MIKKSFEDFGISFDVYSRTSNKTHHKTSSDFFLNLYEKGIFDEKVNEQYYDESSGQFLADRYIVGTCPNCGNENAYGDQCEKCGTSLSPTELGNPRSMLSGESPVMKETKNWYLPLDRLQPEIEQYINSHSEWKSNVLGQCKSWLNQGLQPRAMTRDLDWGVKVPLQDAEGKVLYVWFDAPIGYITATQELMGDQWEPYWKDEDTRLVHFIGKDNIVFHCIIFPAMLKEHGDYILADNVPANEFMNLEGEKISTSRNWAVWLHEYLQEFPGQQDVLRYALTANAPENKDNDFTWKDFQTRNNSELVAIFGNFVNRAVVLTHKYFDGKIPATNDIQPVDQQVLDLLREQPDKIGQSIYNFKFREALNQMMELARAGNKYLADTEPWKIIKEDHERVKTIMNVALQVAASLGVVCEPFLPFTASKLRDMLKIEKADWNDAGRSDLLAAGHQINKQELLFQKIEDSVVEQQMEKLQKSREAIEKENKKPTVKPMKETIEFDDFMKMDIRVGEILSAEPVPKSNKLLKFTVDTGIDKRTILSGIAKHFSPEEMVGKKVTVLANLAPRKIMGVESQGMILFAENEDGGLKAVSPDDEAENGATIA
jgi:methionyl-tRNA synthetase